MEKEDCFAKTYEISSEWQNCFVVGGLKEMRLGEGSIFPFNQGTKSKLPKTHPPYQPRNKKCHTVSQVSIGEAIHEESMQICLYLYTDFVEFNE